MNDRETQALAAAAAAYENRTDQLRISDEEMAGQLTLDAPETQTLDECPECGGEFVYEDPGHDGAGYFVLGCETPGCEWAPVD